MADAITAAGNILALLETVFYCLILALAARLFIKISKSPKKSKFYYLFFASIAAYVFYRVNYVFLTEQVPSFGFYETMLVGNVFFVIAGILFLIAVLKLKKFVGKDLDGVA